MLLVRFPGISDQKSTILLKNGDNLPSVSCVSQRNVCPLEMLARSRGCLKASRLLLTQVLKFTLLKVSSEFYQGVKQLNCWYCPAKCNFIFHPVERILKDFWLQCLKSSLTEGVSASFKTWCNASCPDYHNFSRWWFCCWTLTSKTLPSYL